jgi:hypothetical protein
MDGVAEALQRCEALWKLASSATTTAALAEAEWLRLKVLELADTHPGLRAISLTTESVYDDEGGYYDTVSTGATVDAEAPGQEQAYEDDGDPEEALMEDQITPECAQAIAGALGLEDDGDGGIEVTVAQLRGTRFEAA